MVSTAFTTESGVVFVVRERLVLDMHMPIANNVGTERFNRTLIGWNMKFPVYLSEMLASTLLR